MFSKPFQFPTEKWVRVGSGVVGGWTTGVKYSFDPKGWHRTWGGKVEGARAPSRSRTPHVLSFRTTGMLRGGYKHVWAFVGLTAYWQNYGSYKGSRTDPRWNSPELSCFLRWV
ncbi:MAG: hypothetical protein IPK50_24065 [Fibrobacterota bacterium]|nr:MAG: hypothetical protein IPK50_24065 [Fibrobacterota bacterium]